MPKRSNTAAFKNGWLLNRNRLPVQNANIFKENQSIVLLFRAITRLHDCVANYASKYSSFLTLDRSTHAKNLSTSTKISGTVKVRAYHFPIRSLSVLLTGKLYYKLPSKELFLSRETYALLRECSPRLQLIL